jgi:hypothetical protein
MTEKLKTLMDESADLQFATPDLDAIVKAGDRKVRRRRLAVGTAGVALAAVAAIGIVLVAGHGGTERSGEVIDRTFESSDPMWTVGSILHTPDQTYPLGHDVLALARTTAGVAYVGDDYRIYSFDGHDSKQIGTTSHDMPFLVSDTDGTLVGWVDGTGDKPAFVIHDLATGEESRYDEYTDAGAYFFAIDGDTAYWLDSRGTVATDLDNGAATILAASPDPRFVMSAENGVVVQLIEDRHGGDLGTDVVGADGQVLLKHGDTETVGALSPDGRWGSSFDSASVVEIATGRQVRLRAGTDALGYDWLGDSTVMVIADGRDDTAQLLRCEVPAGTCTAVGSLDAENADHFALPSFGMDIAMRDGGEASGSSDSVTECTASDDGAEVCTSATSAPAGG